ncbi:hypothetical protein SBA3_1910005 [Candidatus Sulfopaludibacter sp. SbA3]|nr:hypothetical protein SBA3_1910005 [Candidatus Sulfopaludibacter sp. SbA3]
MSSLKSDRYFLAQCVDIHFQFGVTADGRIRLDAALTSTRLPLFVVVAH